jgi:hypothetical protein
MRKLISLVAAIAALAGAGIALAEPAATNPNGEFIDLNVAVTPPVAGTAAAPQGVGVSFNSFTGNRINGNIAPINPTITVRFNRGFKYNGAFFPACKINPTGLSKCSKSAQIGTGTAEVSLAGSNGAPPTFVPATLAAYNGKPFKGKAPTLIIVGLLNGKPTTEFDFSVTQQPTGPYGLAIATIQFPSLSGPIFDQTKFSLNIPDRTATRTVHGRSVKVHLMDAPTTCNGSWEFAQTNTFTNAPPLTATNSQPCTKR